MACTTLTSSGLSDHVSGHAHRSLHYRPALDGLRAVAVTAVIAFHLDPRLLPGGWLGVDLFFVLSGFLITSLLMAEYRHWGSIDVLGFWLSRCRRLLPALLLMLLATLLAAAVWAVPSRRSAIAWDVLSALCYVANWRLLLSDDQYFGTVLGMPSPVRHTWSLAIEEQFYLVFPLLVIGLIWLTRRLAPGRPRLVLSIGLAAVAVASASLMAALYAPGTNPVRVYYGTDTRMFELLIGALAGLWLGPHDFGRRVGAHGVPRPVDRVLSRAAWPALLAAVAAFATLDENASMLFRGGLVAFCAVVAVPICAAASPLPSLFQRVLSHPVPNLIGRLSYSLYLWHWPVIVFGNQAVGDWPLVMRGGLELALTFVLAWLSFRYVETPVRRHGIRSLIPGRPGWSGVIGGACIPAIVIGAILLPRSAVYASALPGGPGVQYSPTANPTAAPQRVTMLGNSVPSGLQEFFPAQKYPDTRVDAAVNYGCEPWRGERIEGGQVQTELPDCPAWRNAWVPYLRSLHPQTVAYVVSQAFVDDYLIDGRTVVFGTQAHDRFIEDSLDQVQSGVASSGATRLVLLNLSCHRLGNLTPGSARISDDNRVRHINRVVAGWAHQRGVQVLDLYGLLCTGGYHGELNGSPLYQDGLHFTQSAAETIWGWILGELQEHT